MHEVSLFRLYLLRATYLLLVVGQGTQIWPLIIDHELSWPLMNGVVAAMLGAVVLLAVIGLRYPLQMLPVLLFEMIWKATWLLSVALPLYLAGQMDPRTQESVYECLVGIIFPIVIPWGYMYAHYVKKPGDRWR